jgi:hypothetical protein
MREAEMWRGGEGRGWFQSKARFGASSMSVKAREVFIRKGA